MTSPCILTVVHKQVDLELFYCCYFFLYNACFFFVFFCHSMNSGGAKKHQSVFCCLILCCIKGKQKYIFLIFPFFSERAMWRVVPFAWQPLFIRKETSFRNESSWPKEKLLLIAPSILWKKSRMQRFALALPFTHSLALLFFMGFFLYIFL